MINKQKHIVQTPSFIILHAIILLSSIGVMLKTGVHFEGQFFMWKIILNESNGMFHNYHGFNDLMFWQWLYEILYSWKPQIAWFTIITQVLVVLSIHILLSLIWILGRVRKVNRITLISFSTVSFLVLSYNLVWVHQNRASFLVVGSALGLIYFIFKQSPFNSIGKLFFYLSTILWFCMGFFYRPEAGLAATMLVLFGVFIITKSFDFRIILRFIPIFGIILFSFAYYSYQLNHNDSFYYQLEPNVEYELIDRKNKVPLSSMTSTKDSARYIAASQWMLGDIKETTPSFLHSLIPDKNNLFHLGIFPFSLKDTDSIKELARDYQELSVNYSLILGVLILLLLISISSFNVKLTVRLALFIGLGLFLLGLSFMVNAFPRVIEPLFALLVTWSILVFLSYYVEGRTKIIIGSLSVIFTLYFGNNIAHSMIKSAHALSQKERTIYTKLEEIKSSTKDKPYVFILEDFFIANTGAFHSFVDFEDKTLLIPSMGQFSGNPAFLSYNAQLTSCPIDDFLCRMQFINDNKEKAVIFSSANRLAVYKEYLSKRYNYTLDIALDDANILFDNSLYWVIE